MPTEAVSPRKVPDLSLVIPCFNEEAVVSHTISRLLKAFQADGYALEIIAVDNGSDDRTGEILRGFAATNPAVLHCRIDRNEGYGNGVLNGFPLANAPWVGIIPADGQVDAEDVVRLYEVAQASNSWVLAKVRRRFRLDGVTRKLVSVSYNLVFRLLWPAVASIDINGSPKLMPREAVTAMGLKSKGWFLDPEIMIKSHAMGIRVVEFNVFARLRGAGVSHVRAGTCWEFLRNLIKYRLSNDWKRELVMSRSEAAPDYCAADVRS
jgi:glycosyltransferase involved in cell wall biosynthesis